MQVFELFDRADPAAIFLNYDDYVSDVTPDHTSKRVDSDIWVRNLGSHLKHFKNAFNIIDADGTYFN